MAQHLITQKNYFPKTVDLTFPYTVNSTRREQTCSCPKGCARKSATGGTESAGTPRSLTSQSRAGLRVSHQMGRPLNFRTTPCRAGACIAGRRQRTRQGPGAIQSTFARGCCGFNSSAATLAKAGQSASQGDLGRTFGTYFGLQASPAAITRIRGWACFQLQPFHSSARISHATRGRAEAVEHDFKLRVAPDEPRRWNFCGSRKNSTISSRSSLASSTPATS